MTDRQREWAERVRAWRASGKTRKAFADEIGVPEATLRWWVRRLETSSDTRPLRPRGRPPKTTVPSVRMAPVVRLPTPAGAPTSPLAVIIGDARVMISPGVDESTLRTVLRALGAVR